ncbi:MAG: glycerol-3-phosphate dehydrogenase [Alphaproteobacteria bacterium]|nr:glycerol-3-phosphate dehydrogenase [Alphaproteobacteria bacterium]
MFDLFIIGGGVNGCGVARDAAGRGLKVYLAEKADLASGTSSASTKLIHGGLRYLEHYAFGLVRESLKEREVLLAMAPHIAWPLRFVLPHHSGLRPAWLIRLGLFLYDHLGGRELLPGCRTLDLRTHVTGAPLKKQFTKGFEYSDCWVDDARLVVLNAMDAAARGAEIHTRTEVVSAERDSAGWRIQTRNSLTGALDTVRAKVVVNAAGPWVGDVLNSRMRMNSDSAVRMVKGSHIVVNRLFDHDRAYIFQNADNRIIFAIPYEDDFTLIGTTDVDFQGDPNTVAIDQGEISYLCKAASEYFETPIGEDQVVWTYSGIRPLYDDGASAAQKATRDFVLERKGGDDQPVLLSVFGGKITTYRHLAEEVLAKIAGDLPGMGAPWTRGAGLPGGDFAVLDFDKLEAQFKADFPFLDPAHAHRLLRLYGTKARAALEGVTDAQGLGRRFGHDLYEVEVAYLMAHEWAATAEDVLTRRTKLNLRFSPDERADLDAWMTAHAKADAA